MLRLITSAPVRALWVRARLFHHEAPSTSSTSAALCSPCLFSDQFILARSYRRDSDRTKDRKSNAKVRNSREPSSKPEHPTYRPDGRHGGEDENGKEEDNDPRKELVAKLKRFFAISLFAYGVLYLLSPRSDGPAGVVNITWSEFVSNLLPTGQIHKIIVFPERDVAFIYTYAGSKTASGEPMASIYRMGIPSVSRFEAEVRAAENAVRLPPEHWIPIQYRRMESVYVVYTSH
ncbi:hypothetical protein GCK32_016499 [Trichostrongylus colubriformis]|uniref:Peptidase M41 FtsH extracellular domain-containing protein n=1 Tax=Trichostrongylus colubriformis TaxID=6319 RepID=A0AAN8FD14_TRICO